MADPKKLTRAEVYRQIDDFRGISRPGAPVKPSVEPWPTAKGAETKPPPRRAGNGNVMRDGLSRIRVD